MVVTHVGELCKCCCSEKSFVSVMYKFRECDGSVVVCDVDWCVGCCLTDVVVGKSGDVLAGLVGVLCMLVGFVDGL